jgi:hypothetical protein
MPTHSGQWKELEKEVARRLRGVRLERGNDYGKAQLDVEHKYMAIDCKWRSTLALWGWFTKLLADNKKIYPGENKIPILAVKKKGQRGILIVIEIDDFIECLNRKDVYNYIKGEQDD